VETATAGIADALTVGEDGRPVVVVDWKSDVNPEARRSTTIGRRCAPIST
jgi:exodeoxyribonuclease-5